MFALPYVELEILVSYLAVFSGLAGGQTQNSVDKRYAFRASSL
jgi:hypothetical protein